MRGTEIIRNILFCVALLAALIGIAGCKMMEARIERQDKTIEEMNAQELHYDADDYFLMVDRTAGLIGFYDGITPLRHTYTSGYSGMSNIPCGVYEAYIQGGTVVLVNTSDDNWATTIPIDKGIYCWAREEYPGGYPALVYE